VYGIDVFGKPVTDIKGPLVIGVLRDDSTWVAKNDPGYSMLGDTDWFFGRPDLVEKFSERPAKFHIRDGLFHQPPKLYLIIHKICIVCIIKDSESQHE